MEVDRLEKCLVNTEEDHVTLKRRLTILFGYQEHNYNAIHDIISSTYQEQKHRRKIERVSLAVSLKEHMSSQKMLLSIGDIGALELHHMRARNPDIKTKSHLLDYKKRYALLAVQTFLPYLNTMEDLIELKEIFDAKNDKHSNFAYLRQEQGRLGIEKYGNTKT